MNNICPPKHLPEWKALVDAIGEFEANRYFIAFNGKILTPEEAKEVMATDTLHSSGWNEESMAQHLLEPDPTTLDPYNNKEVIDSLNEWSRENRTSTSEAMDANSLQPDPTISESKPQPILIKTDKLTLFKKDISLSKQGISGKVRTDLYYKQFASNTRLGTNFKLKFTQVGQSDIWNWTIQDLTPDNKSGQEEQTSMFYREEFSNKPTELEANDPLVPVEPIELDPTNTDNKKAIEIATKLLDKLSLQHGLNYQFVSEEQADKLTSNRQGAAAFNIRDTNYFIQDRLTTKIAIHEVSHPLVRSIAKSNPELFNNLFNKVLSTSESSGILNTLEDLYSDLEKDSDLYKEEVIVRALTESAKNNLNSIPESTGFIGAIKNILYAIKQMLRKAFGKIKIENLDVNTSLDQLGDMLINDSFQIDTELLNQGDIASYVKDYTEYKDNLIGLTATGLQDLTDKLYSAVNSHLNSLKDRKDYTGMLDILKDTFTQSKLEEIKRNLGKYHTTLNQGITELQDDFNVANPLMSNMASSLYRLESIAKTIKEGIEKVHANPTPEDVYKINYYRTSMTDWTNFINEGLKNISGRIGVDNPLAKLLANIKLQLEANKSKIEEVEKRATKDITYSTLQSVINVADKTHNEQIASLVKKNASLDLINKIKRNYEEIKLSPEKINKILNGELGDADAFYSYFGGFANNRDPIIASFGMFVKNNMTDVDIKCDKFANSFWNEVTPLVHDAKIGVNDPKELADKISFVDKSYKKDDNDTIVVKEVRTLLSPYKDYRFPIAKMEEDIRVAKKEYVDTLTPESKLKLATLRQERAKHKKEYFWQENDEAIHAFDNLFDTEIGAEAKLEVDMLWSKLNELEGTVRSDDELDRAEILPQIDQIYREVRQLYSTIDLNGNKKSDREIAKVSILKLHREGTQGFYEWLEKPGEFDRALANFEQQLILTTPKDSIRFKNERQSWIDNNIRTVIKPEFWEEKRRIVAKLQSIFAGLPSTIKNKIDVSSALENINEAVYGFKDSDGQPQGNLLSPGRIALVKKNQDFINKAREEFAGLSGLTTLEMNELSDIFDRIKSGEDIPTSDRKRLNDLLNKKKTEGLTKGQKADLAIAFEELSNLQHKEATDYYLDIFNNYLSKLDTSTMTLNMGVNSIDKNISEDVLKDHIINNLLSQSQEFKDWFENNHLKKKVFNKETMQQEEKWERLYIWNINRPNDPRFIETTDIKDEIGNTVETIKGKPSLRFYKREVKSEYKTKKIIGKTVDSFGNWLPKEKGQSPDERYINHAYHDLEKNDPKSFKVLEKIKEHYLAAQEGYKKESKLYLDLPRYRPTNIEIAQRVGYGQAKKNAATTYFDKVKSHFQHTSDDLEEGLNTDFQTEMIKTYGFDNELSKIPVGGTYDLDIDQVSLNIPESIMKYVHSAERQKKLIEINPVASALKNVLLDQGIKNIKGTDKKNLSNRVVKYFNKKGQSVRSQAVDAFYAREFQGEHNAGLTQNMKGVDATVKMLSHTASFGMFAMNIPSALKNSFSAMVQNMIEASAGRYLNINTYHQGIAWSGKASMDISMELYKGKTKGYNVQLIEVFDPSSTRFQETFGKNLSRSFFKDSVSFSWLFSPRKWTELNATLGLFGGMMYHQKVNQTIDGKTKEISYIDAFEIRNGQIALRPGIDSIWGLEGKKFKEFRSTIQSVNNKLNGAFSKFDAPLMDRFLVYRMISFMRRYFPAMASNRFSPERLDVGLGDVSRGYYLDAITAFSRTITTGGKYLQWMSPREKKAFLRLFSEVGHIVGITLAMSMLFGWDPDDKDRYEKLRHKSGTPDFLPGVEPDPSHPFSMEGYMSNHTLNLLMNIKAESTQWVPVPGLGLQDYQQSLDWNSVMFGPTITVYSKMLNDLVNAGNESGYYKKAVGPYEWQQDDSFKFWNHLGHTMGITGGSIDPVLSIKNYQSMRARK